MKAPIGYHLVCLSIRSSKNLFRMLVFELQPLLVVTVTKKFMDDLCTVNTPSLSSTEVYMED